MKYQHVWKRVSAMILAGILAGTMTACGGQTADESETAQQAQTNEASDKEYQVGVIVKTTASEYWSYVVAVPKRQRKIWAMWMHKFTVQQLIPIMKAGSI